MLLFMYIYTILGLDLFAYKARFNDNYEIDYADPDAKFIIWNFNNFVNGLRTVYISLTGNNWTWVYYLHYRAVGGFKASAFFLSLILICQ